MIQRCYTPLSTIPLFDNELENVQTAWFPNSLNAFGFLGVVRWHSDPQWDVLWIGGLITCSLVLSKYQHWHVPQSRGACKQVLNFRFPYKFICGNSHKIVDLVEYLRPRSDEGKHPLPLSNNSSNTSTKTTPATNHPILTQQALPFSEIRSSSIR